MSAEKVLKELLADVEFRREVGLLCCHVRRIDETDLRTIQRLVEERGQLLRLLSELQVKHAGHGDARYFDHGFKEFPGPVGSLRKHLGLDHDVSATTPGGWNEQQKMRERAAAEQGFEYADRMSTLWGEEAQRRRNAEK
jgi:hypothetical protein